MNQEVSLDCERLLRDEMRAMKKYVTAEAQVDTQIRGGGPGALASAEPRHKANAAEALLREAQRKNEQHAKAHCSR